jgi:UDP-N-acetylmuramoyl-L-alanyl-D-glutamate--2,6-diaminopimelate ligase
LESAPGLPVNGGNKVESRATGLRGTDRSRRLPRRLQITDPTHGRAHAGADLAVQLLERGPAQTFSARAIHLTTQETRFQLVTPQGVTPARVPLVGRRNLHCVLAALAVARALPLPAAALARGLMWLPPVPGRLEPVAARPDVPVFVEAAPSADDLAAALEALQGAGAGRLLLLVGCDRRQPSPQRLRFGEVAARLAHLTVVTSNNPGREAPERIAADVAGGYRAVRGELPPLVPDRRAAIHQLIRAARPGDCVVLAGKGHETWEEVGDCVVPFDDREHACEALAARPAGGRTHGGAR